MNPPAVFDAVRPEPGASSVPTRTEPATCPAQPAPGQNRGGAGELHGDMPTAPIVQAKLHVRAVL